MTPVRMEPRLASAADDTAPGLAAAADPLAARLTALSLDQLRGEWRKLYRTAPPARLSRDLMLRAITYKLQETAHGGLRLTAKRRLASLAQSLTAGGEMGAMPAIRLKPGATLVREWHGRSHAVTVLEDGFEHQGQRFASLSVIARHITGAHWSGPRFFGLARAAKPSVPAAKPRSHQIGDGTPEGRPDARADA